ncbi:MAG: DUF1156 domain-containing protein [Desulfobacteraceae bacterium]
MTADDQRLIEHGFPCHQVGAETQRERGASSALPPLYYLHVWWARRPLTPSRAAILASLLPADYDPELFVRRLGIEKVQALVNGQPWTLNGNILAKVIPDGQGGEVLPVDAVVLRSIAKENQRRQENINLIAELKISNPNLAQDPILLRWEWESQLLPEPFPDLEAKLKIRRTMGDPAGAKERISLEEFLRIRTSEDKYGYNRAYTALQEYRPADLTILDPTAGGGSIPFEALRLGYRVIANELNPVAAVILHATLDYPARFGPQLTNEIQKWCQELRFLMVKEVESLFPASPLPEQQCQELQKHLQKCTEILPQFLRQPETLDGFIFCRQVTCPHCHGEAPLLNSCWLSKEEGDQWGVKIITDGRARQGKVRFETYRVAQGRGPEGEDPNLATVKDGVGTCVHCRQAIADTEIKAQARGESPLGSWQDRLYCVVAVRFEPLLDKHGQPQRYKSGPRKGEIRTRKVRFFRPPNAADLAAIKDAEQRLQEKWPQWEAQGLIPTEKVPEGHKTAEPLRYGMPRFCDMFTPRQLLGHLTLVEGLNRLKPQILAELGPGKGRAVVTYLQFAIDKGVDYNSRQTRWIPQRAIVSGTFGRHDYSLKWTFGEMIFTGPNSGAAWGLSQIVDAYQGMAALLSPLNQSVEKGLELPLVILNRTAAHLPEIPDRSVDLVCMDPPYYNNVQYAELSDYFYVWQKRTLGDLYPGVFDRRLTDKKKEAVANPTRDGSELAANQAYELMMAEIFRECRRILKDDGIMTLMFTHKSQKAWESLIRSLIDSGLIIISSFPIESEFAKSMHQMETAAAASSIFISCRKREKQPDFPALWTGLGGQGVQPQIRRAVEAGLKEFKPLRLNPVDEMVACYGRALRVLSEQWPVLDGDEPVRPLRAMNEASRVVAENHIRRLTQERLSVDDLDPESAMALTLFGIWGLNEFSYDEALNLSKSLNIALVGKPAGYRVEGRMIGINQQGPGRRSRRADAETVGFHAPLVRKGSKLRLTRPEERSPQRLAHPQTDWDVMLGVIVSFREGDVPVARAYLEQKARDHQEKIVDLLKVWAAEVDEPDLQREAKTLLFGFELS